VSNASFAVTRLIAPNSGPLTGSGTNTFIVGDAAGCLVIDPGCADEAHLKTIQAIGKKHGGVQLILVTHAHPDHLGGTAELAAITHAPILALNNTERGVPFADVILKDGQVIAVGANVLTVLATPGHRFDHIALWHPPTGIIFAGDLMTGGGTVVIIPPEGDMAAYLASLDRLQTLPLKRLWPGHGEPIDDPHTRIAQLIAHRLERERAILLALVSANELRTVEELMPLAYPDINSTMYDWAVKSLQAHLLKLEADGRVMRPPGADMRGPWKSQ
jgi:glyoxylase-like metal-dependent hydrolase (beta-lactamase superfamily II)